MDLAIGRNSSSSLPRVCTARLQTSLKVRSAQPDPQETLKSSERTDSLNQFCSFCSTKTAKNHYFDYFDHFFIEK